MYRRSRAEMPAHDWEVQGALDDGVELKVLKTPKQFVGNGGRLAAVEALAMRLGEPDDSGRRRPIPVEGSEAMIAADLVVLSIGLRPDTRPFDGELKQNRNETLVVNPETLQTPISGVFAGGDAVTGPLSIVSAIGQGKRAAHFINRFLRSESLEGVVFDDRLPIVPTAEIIARGPISRRERIAVPELKPAERMSVDAEVEGSLTEDEARASANRCLDCGGCSECHECVHACPANAIDFSRRSVQRTAEVEAAIVSTGFKLFDPHNKPSYGYGRFPNVVTAMQMDRLVAPTRPFNHTLRPSDGKQPDNIAFILCTGSRDCTVNKPVVLPGLLHVLDQASPANHGRAADGRHHRLLLGRESLRQGL